jgi:hypothetical protein
MHGSVTWMRTWDRTSVPIRREIHALQVIAHLVPAKESYAHGR